MGSNENRKCKIGDCIVSKSGVVIITEYYDRLSGYIVQDVKDHRINYFLHNLLESGYTAVPGSKLLKILYGVK